MIGESMTLPLLALENDGGEESAGPPTRLEMTRECADRGDHDSPCRIERTD